MALKIINPFWLSPAEKKAAEAGPDVVAWLKANAENRVVTMAELREGVPARAADLNRAVVNLICKANGIEMQGLGDAE